MVDNINLWAIWNTYLALLCRGRWSKFCMESTWWSICKNKWDIYIIMMSKFFRQWGEVGITFRTLFWTALAAYKYDIRSREEKISMEVVIMYGGNETYAPNSVGLIKRVSIYPVTVHVCENMGHAEVLIKKPQIIYNIIKE